MNLSQSFTNIQWPRHILNQEVSSTRLIVHHHFDNAIALRAVNQGSFTVKVILKVRGEIKLTFEEWFYLEKSMRNQQPRGPQASDASWTPYPGSASWPLVPSSSTNWSKKISLKRPERSAGSQRPQACLHFSQSLQKINRWWTFNETKFYFGNRGGIFLFSFAAFTTKRIAQMIKV